MDGFGAIGEFALGELTEEQSAIAVPLAVVEVVAPAPQVTAGAQVAQSAPVAIEVAAPAPQVVSGVYAAMAAPAVLDVVAPVPETGTVGVLIDLGVERQYDSEPALAEAEVTGLGGPNTFIGVLSVNVLGPVPTVATGVALAVPYAAQVDVVGVAPEIGARRQPSRVQALAS